MSCRRPVETCRVETIYGDLRRAIRHSGNDVCLSFLSDATEFAKSLLSIAGMRNWPADRVWSERSDPARQSLGRFASWLRTVVTPGEAVVVLSEEVAQSCVSDENIER